MALISPPQVLDLVVGNRDPRQMRDTADGLGVNRHGTSLGPRGTSSGTAAGFTGV